MKLTKWVKNDGVNCVIFLLDDNNGRVISLFKQNNGDIEFTEECDGHYSATMTKQDAIIALQEAIDWINSDE